MNPYFPSDDPYNTTAGYSSSMGLSSNTYGYGAGSYSGSTGGYGELSRPNAFRDGFDRNPSLKNSRSGEHYLQEDVMSKQSGYNYGGLDKLKSFTPTGMSGMDPKRPMFPESSLAPPEPQTRGRKSTFDSGNKYGNSMYASQMVMPSSGGFSKLGGLGGLSGMGRSVAEEPLPSFDHHFGLEPPAMKSYTPMADALLKRSHNEHPIKDFKPNFTNDAYKPRPDMDLKPTPNFLNTPSAMDYYNKRSSPVGYSNQQPELHHTASDTFDKKPMAFQQQQHLAPPNRLEFKSGHEGLRVSPGNVATGVPGSQPPLMFEKADGSRPSNNNNFKKKLVFNKDDRVNPQTPTPKTPDEHRQSPMAPVSKSERVLPEPGELPSPVRSKSSRPPCKTDFVIGKKLGKGKFGDVYLSKHKLTGFVCAIKIIPKSMLKDQQLQNQIIRQLKIQCFLHHFNIASMYGYFDDEENVYFLLELCCDGQLYNVIKQRKRLPEAEAKQIVRQICSAAEYLHRQRVIHRDLKLQNIIMHEGIAKMCDFGWAVYSEDEYRTTFCFSPVYRPPELIMSGKYDQKVDIWAIGILTYELLIGKIPFKINSQQDLIKICKQDIRFPEYVQLSDNAKNFITSILKKDPKERFDVEELMMHPFLKEEETANAFDIPAFL